MTASSKSNKIFMRTLKIILLGLLLCLNLYSHPWKPSHYLIIDTDGGIDDLRAITMLLASPDVRVLGITVTSGALEAENAYIKVKSLLNSFRHEGIPVGITREFVYKPSSRSIAGEIKWGNESDIEIQKAPGSIELIKEILAFEKTRMKFVCLGGMTTASIAITEVPDFKIRVKEIIWSGNGLNDKKDYNYNIDNKSVATILKEEIPVLAIEGFGESRFFTDELIEEISLIKNVYSKSITGFFESEIVKNHSFSFSGNDEMIPLYLHFPEMFKNVAAGKNYKSSPFENSLLKTGTLKILKGETAPKNQVIKVLPADPSFYFDDVNSSVTEIISKYGMDEWSSGVIANELHRHLGVFAIVGVKMGIRAREYFNTGVDEFRVTSRAGSMPPLSCMNDGLQVSTGATPGHGLLTISSDTLKIPSAEFTYLNHKIRLSLKPEIAQKISSELKEINFIHGLDSNIYWELVRKNSIKYWLELDRNEIFIIEDTE